MKAYYRYIKDEECNYQEKGDTPLDPIEVMKIRNKFVGNDPYKFQLWVMILLGIKGFLRSSELSSPPDDNKKDKGGIVMSRFIQDLCFTDNFNPKSVVVRVWGKTDEKFENVKFWRDEAIPEFCPIIYFMVQSKKKTKLS